MFRTATSHLHNDASFVSNACVLIQANDNITHLRLVNKYKVYISETIFAQSIKNFHHSHYTLFSGPAYLSTTFWGVMKF